MTYNLTRNYVLLGAHTRTNCMEKYTTTRPFQVVICCVEPRVEHIIIG